MIWVREEFIRFWCGSRNLILSQDRAYCNLYNFPREQFLDPTFKIRSHNVSRLFSSRFINYSHISQRKCYKTSMLKKGGEKFLELPPDPDPQQNCICSFLISSLLGLKSQLLFLIILPIKNQQVLKKKLVQTECPRTLINSLAESLIHDHFPSLK